MSAIASRWACCAVFAWQLLAVANAQTITTVAGGGPTGPMDALQANLRGPYRVAVDAAGNVYVAAGGQRRVFQITPSGVLTVAAGNGYTSFADGDGGPATKASLQSPADVALDGAGNLYIADLSQNTVRKVDRVTGVISTVAGTGIGGFSGDGGPATSARLQNPQGIALDAAGNLYIAEQYNQRIRKVNAATGVITTVAGTGTAGFSGDGGPATSARLFDPYGVAVDAAGNLYIADSSNNRVRKVNAATGVISTVAGNGLSGFSGDGGPATSARLSAAYVSIDAAGNLYIADTANRRIRRVTVATGVITTVAGNGLSGFSGDGGSATSASFTRAYGVALDTTGNLYIPDLDNYRVRKVDAATQVISTIAGNGYCCFSGDGGAATNAALYYAYDVAVDAAGNLYISDNDNNRIRKVDGLTGVISTAVGTGVGGFSGDGGPAPSAQVNWPYSVALDATGNLYIADLYNYRIRKVARNTGLISTVADNGSCCSGAADGANLVFPYSVAVDAAGAIYASVYTDRVVKVDPMTGVAHTVAGSGTYYNFSGDGGPATSAHLYGAAGVALDAAGNLYIADSYNNRVRKVNAVTGVISTVAGNGTPGFGGDGAAATLAQLNNPYDVAFDGAGNLFISDSYNHRVRKVDAVTGFISTVAGNGEYGAGGDGGPPTSAALTVPLGITIDAAGNLYIAHGQSNGRVSKVTGVAAPFDTTAPVIAPTLTGTLGDHGWYTSNVTVTWAVTDTQSAVTSQGGCDAVAVATDTAGASFICTATSAGGTATGSVTVKRDATAPNALITTPSEGSSYLLNASLLADYSCGDAMSGLASCAGPVASGAALTTASVGPQSFEVDASDNAGNDSSVTHSYSVRFGFVGFFQPMDNQPVVNTVNAGRVVPVKWRLLDGDGVSLHDVATFKSLTSQPVSCSSGLPTDAIEETMTQGSSGIRYDSSSDQFIYNWATVSGWKNQCRVLVLELADGQKQLANFKFK